MSYNEPISQKSVKSNHSSMVNYPYFTYRIDYHLAELLGMKIQQVDPNFQAEEFCRRVMDRIKDRAFQERVAIIADELNTYLPDSFEEAWSILSQILGPVNPEQTGMFTKWYWLMPVAKYVELHGIESPRIGYLAIAEITKRNTGEFAIRPYIRRYPDESIKVMKNWAISPDFHLRRLASEGLRPKLPWATKLDTFRLNPEPVFQILSLLKEDEVIFVKKSVANHLTDWLRVNPAPTRILINNWRESSNQHTQWIIRRATRKIS